MHREIDIENQIQTFGNLRISGSFGHSSFRMIFFQHLLVGAQLPIVWLHDQISSADSAALKIAGKAGPRSSNIARHATLETLKTITEIFTQKAKAIATIQ